MKRVICIKSEVFISTGEISIRKGSIYHVIDEVSEDVAIEEFSNKFSNKFGSIVPAKGKWYSLLEIPNSRHHECNFLEIPEDDFDYLAETNSVLQKSKQAL